MLASFSKIYVTILKFLFKTNYWINRKKFRENFYRSLEEVKLEYRTRNELYRYCDYLFNYGLDKDVQEHRLYFSRDSRGFGEDALHAMWSLIFRDYKPINCLEIGVYRGQVISLWALLSEKNKYGAIISGISPFSSAGDGVSNYLKNLNYKEDILFNYSKFSNNKPILFEGYSNDDKSIEFINSTEWDLIYIDGSHDYEIALSDYKSSLKALKQGGLLVLDDSSLFTDYKPSKFSFAGHPGPSKIVSEIAMNEMEFIAGVGHNNIFRKK